MPNQKSSKGKKSKRTNSSGDEQENGGCAAAAGGAAAAAAAAAATAAPRTERSSGKRCWRSLEMLLSFQEKLWLICTKSPCDSPGLSPPSGFNFSPTPVLGSGGAGLRGSRQLGEFFKSAVHMDPQRKHLLAGGALSRPAGSAGGPHLDPGSVFPLQLSFALPLHPRLTGGGDGAHPHPVQFLRRLDLSELLTHVPRHKLNTYHVRMEDDAQAGQGEELRRSILTRSRMHNRSPLKNLSTCRLMHLYAICVDCLEGVHKIVCIKCKSRWDGSWHQLGTMYTYDILAASPCCQARLNCKHCGKPVVDVRVGMQYFSEYSNVQQCPHCGNLDYHFVKPFSSYKVLEAY
uniref:Hdc homolog, cell cycle regulator n=1 Tax=Poecilia reticulata TaxID=8081 RepID=A0A3P9PMB3_POERE